MAVIIFRLKDVPEDEADEVRELLRANHLDFYETSAGKWGISIAAIWLKDDSQKERARALIDDYQSKKIKQVREELAQLRSKGELETFVARIRHHPLQAIFVLLFVLFILYLTIIPFTGIKN
jgi:Fe2+ transport system protein B